MSSFRARLALRHDLVLVSVSPAGVGDGRRVRERVGDAGVGLFVRQRGAAADAQHPVARERVVAETRDPLVGPAARDRDVGAGHPAAGRVRHALGVDAVFRLHRRAPEGERSSEQQT